jgi:hypothetical protein
LARHRHIGLGELLGVVGRGSVHVPERRVESFWNVS